MTKMLVIMDTPDQIRYKKDTTLALMLEAQSRKWELYYANITDLMAMPEGVTISCTRCTVAHEENWLTRTITQHIKLKDFDVVMMRKDPPFNAPYLYATYLLELAEREGCFIINSPQAIRNCNEKLYTLWFQSCLPPHLVATKKEPIIEFLKHHPKIVLKPLDNMGGEGIFLLEQNSPNIQVIIETVTQNETVPAMAQAYIPEIKFGDKRIMMINGEPYPYALARVPSDADFRGNLAKGAKGVGHELTERDRWICAQVGPTLKRNGLLLVGLDIIGDYLTEINVTSPTCVREIEAAFKVDMSGIIIDMIANQLKSRYNSTQVQ